MGHLDQSNSKSVSSVIIYPNISLHCSKSNIRVPVSQKAKFDFSVALQIMKGKDKKMHVLRVFS